SQQSSPSHQQPALAEGDHHAPENPGPRVASSAAPARLSSVVSRIDDPVCGKRRTGQDSPYSSDERTRPAMLFLTEQDVQRLLTPAMAIEAVEAVFRRQHSQDVVNVPRSRLTLPGGVF